MAQKDFKHGMSRTRVYNIWRGMVRRCHNPKDARYRYYGGRGISVCKEWREDFTRFYADMGEPPTDKHSIDRIKSDGNYEPGNCRWATQQRQCANINRRTPKASRYVGVHRGRRGKGWTSCLRKGAKKLHFATHRTAIEAALDYDKASFALHGREAVMNFPERHIPRT